MTEQMKKQKWCFFNLLMIIGNHKITSISLQAFNSRGIRMRKNSGTRYSLWNNSNFGSVFFNKDSSNLILSTDIPLGDHNKITK